MEKDHLEFYLEHGISPVHQNISNLSIHLERRKSLYQCLGLPRGFFRGKKILEVGPASGENSLYVAACEPDKFDLLEPNPVAVDEIPKLYRQLNVPHTIPNIIMQTLEKFETDQTYDIVICEGWLGISDSDRNLMKKLADFVNKEGVLVTTLASPVGFLYNIVRRLLANQLLSIDDDFEKKTNKLLIAFSPHLDTLIDMSCPQIDWVQDSLLNPGFLMMHPNPTTFFKDLGQDYSIYNSYPRFSSDWRWYKSLYGENKKFNDVFLDNYLKNIHNLLDFRFDFTPRQISINNELEKLCLELRNLISEYEINKNQSLLADSISIVKNIYNNIDYLDNSIKNSVNEILYILQNKKFDLESISRMNHFNKCFGRELIYVSVLRDD